MNNNIRDRIWSKHYPNCMDDVTDIFDGRLPSVKEVAAWKSTWNDTTRNYITIERKVGRLQPQHVNIAKTCFDCDIHPYLWDTFTISHSEKAVSFYYEEHFIMFKLAWQE